MTIYIYIEREREVPPMTLTEFIIFLLHVDGALASGLNTLIRIHDLIGISLVCMNLFESIDFSMCDFVCFWF